MSKNQPRRHHYIPGFLLAKFTQSGRQDGQLFVFNTTDGQVFESRPAAIAYERDYHTIHVPGIDPLVIEKQLATLEEESARILADVDTWTSLPAGKSYTTLMEFIGALATRVPTVRKIFNESLTELATMTLRMIADNKERWQSHTERLRQEGRSIPDDLKYEDIVALLKQEKPFRMTASTEWHISNMLTGARTIIPHLARRNWAVVHAVPGAGPLICSDSPVSLEWTRKELQGGFWAPGFGMSETEVAVPLSQNTVLLGRFECPDGVAEGSRALIALMNSRTAASADRHLYCGFPDFPLYDRQNQIRGVGDWQNEVRKQTQQE